MDKAVFIPVIVILVGGLVFLSLFLVTPNVSFQLQPSGLAIFNVTVNIPMLMLWFVAAIFFIVVLCYVLSRYNGGD